ncbi:MAG TPA: hypothetical protein EYO84_12485 [Planctomycetes bacterium]|nr:hypothetical protein [Planctomycetota bacterium]
MLRAIGSRSYPTCVIMDLDGKVILRNDSQGAFRPTSEDRLKSSLELAQQLLDARKGMKEQPDSASAKATVQILEAILEIRPIPAAELDRVAVIEGVAESVRQRFDRWRAIEPISKILKDYVAKIRLVAREDKETRDAAFKVASEKMLALFRDGIALDDPRQGIFSDFWRLVFEGAISARDVETAEHALSIYRRAYGSRPDLKMRIDRMATRLGALRQGLEERDSDNSEKEELR